MIRRIKNPSFSLKHAAFHYHSMQYSGHTLFETSEIPTTSVKKKESEAVGVVGVKETGKCQALNQS